MRILTEAQQRAKEQGRRRRYRPGRFLRGIITSMKAMDQAEIAEAERELWAFRELQEGDVVVAQLGDEDVEFKQLYTLHVKMEGYRYRADQIAETASGEMSKSYRIASYADEAYANLVMSILTQCLRRAFDVYEEWAVPPIAIRHGWEIVIPAEK